MRHFLSLSDWSTKELWQLIQLATYLKMEQEAGGNRPILKGKTLALLFQKPSLRTRVSFDVAMKHLGGDTVMLGPEEIQLGKRESVADIARVLSAYVQAIVARVFDHQHVLDLAKYATVPVINGLSDGEHPCQALADIMTIFEHFGNLKGLRLAYIGDGNNVASSLLLAASHFGVHFSAATPNEYEIPARIQVQAADHARRSGATVQMFHDPQIAANNADVIYTDTWVSMGQEAEAEKRLTVFKPFQVNQQLLDTASKDAIVMHCMPAHRGQEITDEVADGPRSVIFDQAENRLHVQKAVLVKLLRLGN